MYPLRLPVLGSLILALAAGGCGFIHASNVSHNKPSGFVLRGHVTVPLATAGSGPAGSTCTAPPTAADIVSGALVTVTDPAGKTLAQGTLGPGVLAGPATGPTCDFPFEIPGVPGDWDSYGVAVARRTAQTFPGQDLREDQSAVLTVSPSGSQ